MKLRRCCAVLLLSTSFAGCAIAADSSNITIDLTKQGAPVPSHLYGIFFEEINHVGDGGLYAELVRNRGFEDANVPPACRREGKFIVFTTPVTRKVIVLNPSKLSLDPYSFNILRLHAKDQKQ